MAQVLAFTPVTFLVLLATLEAINPTLEEASNTLGARPAQTLQDSDMAIAASRTGCSLPAGFHRKPCGFRESAGAGGGYDVLSHSHSLRRRRSASRSRPGATFPHRAGWLLSVGTGWPPKESASTRCARAPSTPPFCIPRSPPARARGCCPTGLAATRRSHASRGPSRPWYARSGRSPTWTCSRLRGCALWSLDRGGPRRPGVRRVSLARLNRCRTSRHRSIVEETDRAPDPGRYPRCPGWGARPSP